jgi:hypothetical protein
MKKGGTQGMTVGIPFETYPRRKIIKT